MVSEVTLPFLLQNTLRAVIIISRIFARIPLPSLASPCVPSTVFLSG